MRSIEPFHAGDGLGKAGEYDVGQRWEFIDGVPAPIIPDDSVKGLLREAARELLDDSDHYILESCQKDKEKSEIFNILFEYAQGDSLFVSSLRPELTVEEKEGDLFSLISQTAIDDGQRKARHRTLRTIQCGRAGLKLKGTISGRFRDSDKGEIAKKVLLDAVKYMRELGGKKRRGIGSLRLLPELQIEDLSSATILPEAIENASAGAPVRLILVWEAKEPVSFTAGNQIGNLVPTLNHMPGSSILGMFRHEYEWSGNTKKILARKLLEDSSPLVFTDALPLPSSYEKRPETEIPVRMPIPCPLAVQFPKVHPYQPVHMFWKETTEDEAEKSPPKRKEGWYIMGDRLYQPEKIQVMRNRIDENTGRVDEKKGSLFVSERLPAGTRFASEIILPDFGTFNLFREVFDEILSGPVGMGRGRKEVRVIGARAECMDLSGAKQADLKHDTGQMVVHLASDAICRDGSLRYLYDLKPAIEQIASGWKVDQQISRAENIRSFTQAGGIPGFNVVRVKAGSSYLLKPVDDASVAQQGLRSLLERSLVGGLGLNTLSGHGRFVIELEKPATTSFEDCRAAPAAQSLPSRERMFWEASDFAEKYKNVIREVYPNQIHKLLNMLKMPDMQINEAFQAAFERDTIGSSRWKDDLKNKLRQKITSVNQIDFLDYVIRWYSVL
jgi:CRISPR/Cas system CSM-associated protein Csm3 (group 7 of RAMP superfamily)